MRKRRNEKVLPAVRPNVGLEAVFRRKMVAIVDDMHDSVRYWVKAAWRKSDPVMARDDVPAVDLQGAIDDLSKRWKKRFNEAAPELAAYFARRVSRRSDDALKAILRRNGISVRFVMTPAMRDILRATIEQNVALIKSIPEQYLGQVQGSVMRSVQAGGDLGALARELEKQYGVTKRRAALIARTQNNMATASMTHARQTEIGIKEAIWLHSHGGREPRPTHLANDGERYKVAEGWFDPDPKVRRRIWPGELINCRCVTKPIVKGFS